MLCPHDQSACLLTAILIIRLCDIEQRHEKTSFLYMLKQRYKISFVISARLIFAVSAKLISAFIFATRIVQSLYFLKLKPLIILCGSTTWFVSDLVGNPECWFSHNKALLILSMTSLSVRLVHFQLDCNCTSEMC